MTGAISLYILAALIILLGGLSLILQKVYKIETEKGEKTVIDVPFFGKLTTNYPAIAFVFIGSILAAYGYDKAVDLEQLKLEQTINSTAEWFISGRLVPPEGQFVNFGRGHLSYQKPKCTPQGPDIHGFFSYICDIKKGVSIEDEVKQIDFTLCGNCGKSYFAQIDLSGEVKNFKNNKPSIIKLLDDNKIIYKDITLTAASIDIESCPPQE
jgi:hypothetical protein